MSYKNYSKILFATDFSFISEYAFNYAVTLAQSYDARLIVMHVINVSLELCRLHGSDTAFEKIKAEIAERDEKRLAEFCYKRLRYWNSTHRTDFTNFEKCAVFGLPWVELLKKADEERVDILVMGTHSSHDIDRLVLGSTVKRVFEQATFPILTVRPPFWMICMKFRNNPHLPLARTKGSFITPRDKTTEIPSP